MGGILTQPRTQYLAVKVILRTIFCTDWRERGEEASTPPSAKKQKNGDSEFEALLQDQLY